MQHWILRMSPWYCLSPFRTLLLKRVHWTRNLIQWMSIIRLLRKSPTLTSGSPNLFQKFTSSISHLSLAVLISDSDHQIWRLFRLKVLIMMLRKTLASVTTGLLTRIMLPFRHALVTSCGKRHFQTFLKVSLSF